MARHVYLCPLRWADMDQLGHVNNVTYVDYLQEARVDMFRVHSPVSGGEELAEAVVVVRHEVEYAAPLVYRLEPVRIEVWVTQVRASTFTLAYEIVDVLPDGTRTVYLRARSLMAPYVFATERPRRISATERGVLSRHLEPEDRPRAVLPRDSGDAQRYRFQQHVRFSDVDVFRHVNNVKYFEYIQEARIVYVWGFPRPDDAPPFSVVVARIDVDYAIPILLRPEPYPIDCWIDHIGRSSFWVVSEIGDGHGAVLARAKSVMVPFDERTERSTPIPDWLRTALEAEVSPRAY